MILNFDGVTFGYGGNLIFSDVSFSVDERDRIGLVGANGEGKTTLLKLATGELSPDSGKITLKNGARVGYLAQNGGYSSGNTVYGEMREVLKEDFAAVKRLSELSERLAEEEFGGAEFKTLSAKIDSLDKFISSRDSFNADVKIKTVLNGMGFNGRYDMVIDDMSGGEKTRLKLVRLLLEQPDLLILDEPTNHLDLNTLFWLEDYLSAFKGALIVVSHDRYFLDKLCRTIYDLENKELNTYCGNYSKYKILKEERNARLTKEYEARIEEINRLQTYVDKNIVRATTAKSAQSRVKRIERTEIPPKPHTPPKPPVFSFEFTQNPAEIVLSASDLNLSAGEKELICGGELVIKRGSKTALIGENGVGKTTLLRAIANGDGKISLGRWARPALYDQEGLNLNPQNTVLAELWERHVGATQTEIRALLARSGLFAEDMEKRVCELSGGERAKLALAVLQSEKSNFLILDEPTNHLDLPSRESLERALKEYAGTVLFVSHDRYFISAVADGIIEISDKKLNTFAGNYAEYSAAKSALAQKSDADLKSLREEPQKSSRPERDGYRSRRDRAEETKKKERIKQIEEEISRLEEEENALGAELSDKGVLADYKRVNAVTRKLAEIKNILDALYSEYAGMI